MSLRLFYYFFSEEIIPAQSTPFYWIESQIDVFSGYISQQMFTESFLCARKALF